MTLIIVIAIVAAVGALFLLKNSKKKPDRTGDQESEIKGYRIKFFKDNKEVDSKIIR